MRERLADSVQFDQVSGPAGLPEPRETKISGHFSGGCPDVHAPRGRITDPVLARQALCQARAVLFDLDGTLMSSGQVIDGAHEVLSTCAGRAMIVTNNSSDTAESLSASLADAGISMPPSRIVLAGVEAIRTIASRWPGASVMLLANPRMAQVAREMGLTIAHSQPDVVLTCRMTDFSYAVLSAAANAVRHGASFVVANPDFNHPGPHGDIIPETGSIAAAVAAASGRTPDLVLGKPETAFFSSALNRLGLTPQDVVMVGDNPQTDGLGALRLGMPHIILDADLSLRALVEPE